MSTSPTADLAWLHSQFPNLSNIFPIGKGGQKLVFSATHPSDGEVVLKILDQNQDLELTRREVLAARKFQNQRVPKILEVGSLQTTLGTRVWFREERIQGATVREILSSGPLPHHSVLQLALHTLQCLVAAEAERIVHRDVKPDNIIRDNEGNFWLLDFGIARHLDLFSLTPSASPRGCGTPGYAPPEQYRNYKPGIDARCDLFALGVTIYEAAIGENPFRIGARDVLEIQRRVEGMELPKLMLNQLAAPTRRSLRDLVDVMTQKRPIHRPRTAKAALDWLTETCSLENIG